MNGDCADSSAKSSTAPQAAPVTIRFAHNTVDVRAAHADQALAELDERIAEARGGSALFVLHGTGTGRLREAVRAFLGSHPEVASFRDEPDSGGGCTMAVLR
jgi:DNA mismatch repair protein MutS2